MTPLKSARPELENETKISIDTLGKKDAAANRARISRKAKSGMFDVPEIIAVSVASLALLGVIIAYFLMLVPAREEFKRRETERSQRQTQLIDLQAKAQEAGMNAAGTIDLVSSVDRFESNFMPFPVAGNAALYQRLNELIRSNGLRNTAGPEYAPLETIDAEKAAKLNDKVMRGNKQQEIFPGTYVAVTVEGNYANLRRFINDIESTRQFLVINRIEIESNGDSDATGAPSANASIPSEMLNDSDGEPRAQMQPNTINPRLDNNPMKNAPQSADSNPAKRGAVSLRLEMAAYFHRPTAAPAN